MVFLNITYHIGYFTTNAFIEIWILIRFLDPKVCVFQLLAKTLKRKQEVNPAKIVSKYHNINTIESNIKPLFP